MLINSYGVVAIVAVLCVAWIAAMVFYNTHSIITIFDVDYSAGYHAWCHPQTKTELGRVHDDGESTRVAVGDRFSILPPDSWNLAEKRFMKMIGARIIRRKKTKRVILIANKYLPEPIVEWRAAGKPIGRTWI